MSNQEFHQRRLSATPRGVGVMCNFFARTAENATLTDVEGNDYIDFAAGIAVLNTAISTRAYDEISLNTTGQKQRTTQNKNKDGWNGG